MSEFFTEKRDMLPCSDSVMEPRKWSNSSEYWHFPPLDHKNSLTEHRFSSIGLFLLSSIIFLNKKEHKSCLMNKVQEIQNLWYYLFKIKKWGLK
ncbi:hypothetical protein BpHYR1_027626 [Brachionus plicatilis]|uniref:Uncharacterized protein n=1 Tax=Brachionus plicatilis TaxID=10195 RepID=A0A3M7RRH5_BRAPC|nr:hypothetical protein BpHYR1_027626 [Brachionus plicatilis]